MPALVAVRVLEVYFQIKNASCVWEVIWISVVFSSFGVHLMKSNVLSVVNLQLATKRLELLSHYYPNLIRAQSLNHVSVSSS